MKRISSLLLLLGTAFSCYAQQILTLDSCRALALANNKELRISQEKVNAAHYEKKAAFTNYLPKIDLAGGYMRTQKEISLLSDAQKQTIGNLGTNVGGQLQQGMQSAEFQAAMQQLAASNPGLAAGLQGLLPGAVAGLTDGLNSIGQSLVDAFHTDTRNLTVGAATLTQPIFMGGKIIAYNKITKYAERLAESQHATGMQDLILQTDQAYWQIISLVNKKKLAENFLQLVQKLDSDVDKMIQEGVATKADGLSVKVKVNEAEMMLTQVENGLSLSKMLLCQLCGLQISDKVALEDENKDMVSAAADIPVASVDDAMENRTELKMLQNAVDISKQSTKLVRAAYLPQVALTGGYLITNPSLYNGFERKFSGVWNIGVMVRIPVWNWFEGTYKIRAGKTATSIAMLELDEAREKIELQVNQSSFKVAEANKKLAMACKNVERAEENLRCADLGFKEGVMDVTDVMAAQTAWLQACSQKIDADIDVKLTQTNLKKVLGEELYQ